MIGDGIPNKVQVGDVGIDGRIFPAGTKPAAGGLFSDDWFPIQVKQMDKVGWPDIDAFQAVMTREDEGGRQRGFFVIRRTGRSASLLLCDRIELRAGKSQGKRPEPDFVSLCRGRRHTPASRKQTGGRRRAWAPGTYRRGRCDREQRNRRSMDSAPLRA